jgi:hypothetical protein
VVGWLGGCSVEGPVSVAFVTPASGATLTRDQLGSTGRLVADATIQLAIGGDPARVSLAAGDTPLGDATSDQEIVELPMTGPVTLTATAFDDAGAELESASVDVTIGEPTVADCHGWLDLYHLDYTVGPDNLGIADPITVMLPLNGMAYRYSGNTSQRKTLYGDCTLMKSLAQAAPIERAHDIQEVIDIGIYNYRCIDQSLTPPNCSMSQHAYAKAIDLAEFVTGDGTHYSVLNDWVIDTSGSTCTAATENDKDAWLHQLICELKGEKIWNIVLTPNYNADHRNHFHVDLTKDSDFIKRETDGGLFVRPGLPEPLAD